MAVKVSIILPTYNAANTLPAMLDAIFLQTYENYEVIIVDDESTDETREIAERYCQKDERLRLVVPENRGISAARNCGLEKAQGEYVLFYDPSDTVPTHAVSSLHHYARERMADLVIGQICHHNLQVTTITEPSSRLSVQNIISPFDTDLHRDTGLGNKLFRRELIESEQLRFEEGKAGSEIRFLYRFLLASNRLAGCPEVVYDYKAYSFRGSRFEQSDVKSSDLRSIMETYEEMFGLVRESVSKEIQRIEQSDGTQAEKTEEIFQRRNFESGMAAHVVADVILKDYYRSLWSGDEDLVSVASEYYDKYSRYIFPSVRAEIIQKNPDLRLEVGLMTKEELCDNPIVSVIVFGEKVRGFINNVLASYYNQQLMAFEILIEESLREDIESKYLAMPNLRFIPSEEEQALCRNALYEAKGIYAIYVNDRIYPSTEIIRQMVAKAESGTIEGNLVFITAPIVKMVDGNYKDIPAHRAVFTNELDVIKLRSPYNQLDTMYANKLFNVKALKAKKVLFSGDGPKDMNRLYNNSTYFKFQDNSFLTENEDSAILSLASVRVRMGYNRVLRREERRLHRLEKESTQIETLQQKFKKLRNRWMRQLYKWGTIKVLYPIVYKWHARKPIRKNSVIFVVRTKDSLPNAMVYLHSVMEKDGRFDIHIEYQKRLTVRYRYMFKQNLAFIRRLATTNYVFFDEASTDISGFKKRNDTKIVQLWHGCGAFKKFGFSTADTLFGPDAKAHKKYPQYYNYDLVTVSSPDVVWAFEEAMMLEGQNLVHPTGVSRTDVFFQEEYIEEAKERVYDQIPIARNKKIIMYAPTFRGRVAKAYGPDHFDYDRLYEALGEEYIILVKHHPLVKQLPEIPLEYKDSFVFDVTRSMEIEDLICASEICISDYSSLIFEFSLFEKPIILFAYDMDDYLDWRGFYFNFFEMAPGPVLVSTEEIIDYVTNLDTQFDAERMHNFRQKFMASCDGHSTERILKYVGIEM